MKIKCHHCGESILINGMGRPKLNLDGNKVLASLRATGSVTLTAKEFSCSRGSIRNAIKTVSNGKENDSTIPND